MDQELFVSRRIPFSIELTISEKDEFPGSRLILPILSIGGRFQLVA